MDSSALLALQSSQFSAKAKAFDAIQAQATKTFSAPDATPSAFSAMVSAQGATAAGGKAKPTQARNAELGQQFETMALSNLLAPMWDGLKTDGPFGGGQGEEAMRSFYVDAIAKQMAKKGGLGISAMMQKELLKLQGAA